MELRAFYAVNGHRNLLRSHPARHTHKGSRPTITISIRGFEHTQSEIELAETDASVVVWSGHATRPTPDPGQ